MIPSIQEEVFRAVDYTKDVTDEEIRALITQAAGHHLMGKSYSLSQRQKLEEAVFNSMRGLDVIQELVDDEDITEIMVNGANHIYYEKNGALYQWNCSFLSEEKLEDVIQRIVGEHNRVINLSSPIVDTRLSNGARVNIVLPPISLNGATMTIRKFPKQPITMNRLIEFGSITKEAADYLKELVAKRKSIVVTGGTGSGKTTFLNALSEYIGEDERVITIEDSAELQLTGISNLVRMETRGANRNQVDEISIRDLIKTALRMRPDRIIVGECRGAEAFDMLQAMNTGHDGSMSTGHANSCRDMLSRLEMMVRMGMDLPLPAIRMQIVSGIDYLVQVSRMSDRSRKVVEIMKVEGIEDGEIVLRSIYRLEDGHLRCVE